MKRLKLYLTLWLTLQGIIVSEAQNANDSVAGQQYFRLHYIINTAALDSTFVDNAQHILDIKEFLAQVANDSLMEITGIDFRGTASPDGSHEFNVWLSESRLRTFKAFVRRYINIPDSLVSTQSSADSWDEFRAAVAADSNVPMRETVLSIIDEGPKLVDAGNKLHIDHRLPKLKSLWGGKVWDYLKDPILANLRYGDATFYYTRNVPVRKETLPVEMPVAQPVISTWLPRIYLKTNLLGLAAASANLAVEFDFARHWSFTIPVYYCGVDYFKSTIKFRNFTIQPEIRYWPNAKDDNHGFFIGAHFGMMYYNFAVGGSTRYQDHEGRTPALGGGLGLGFRKPISKNKRWHIEYTAGAGAYRLDYSKFHNTSNVKEGAWYGRKQKTFIGLDQAAITITYNFPLTKCERKYPKGGTYEE